MYIDPVPYEKVTPELRKVMQAYDGSIGASEFVRIYAHAPEAAYSFFRFYLPAMVAKRGRIDARITELARLKVAERSQAKP
jgi:hypothetical protein